MDWHNPTDEANWVQEYLTGVAPSPFKPGDPPPFLDIPGLGDACAMQLDYCHAFHLGYGIDAAASTVVLLAKIGHLGPGALDHRLEQAYVRFLAWCRLRKRTTSIKEFSKLKFDMGQTILGFDRLYSTCLVFFWRATHQFFTIGSPKPFQGTMTSPLHLGAKHTTPPSPWPGWSMK